MINTNRCYRINQAIFRYKKQDNPKVHNGAVFPSLYQWPSKMRRNVAMFAHDTSIMTSETLQEFNMQDESDVLESINTETC